MSEVGTGLAAALVADLCEITTDLAEGAYTRSTVAMLDRNLRRRIPSALGATITLTHPDCPDGHPVEVHLVPRTVTPVMIRAALRVPLLQLTGAVRGSVTFYATEACAFADLITDLGALLAVDPAALDEHPALPDHPIEPGISGLVDLTVVNIALGILLNRGRSLTEARAELSRQAHQLDTDLATAARALLDTSCT